MKKWTHRYRYTLKSPQHIDRVGTILTGQVQVGREYSDSEVQELVKKMSHDKFNDATFVECRLVEVRRINNDRI